MYVLLFHDFRLTAKPIYRKGRGERKGIIFLKSRAERELYRRKDSWAKHFEQQTIESCSEAWDSISYIALLIWAA
jgi:hypothetical protein